MDSVIVRYQEIALKGRNRPWFVDRLISNLRAVTADLDVVRVRPLMGRLELVLGANADWVTVKQRIASTFGVANFGRASRSGRSIDQLSTSILKMLSAQSHGDIKSFRVTARRADKTYALTSPEIEREIGGRVKTAIGWNVDLVHPDLVIWIEILPTEAFYSIDKYPGPGGLPSGTSGPVMSLLSGGIDSPVAAYRLMKRGCRVRFVHFHSYPLLSHASIDKVRELTQLLTGYQLKSRLYLVAFGDIQRQIVLSAPAPLRVVLYRRFMMRIAQRLARRCRARALVTGEAVGQVASQTIENLSVINAAVTLPVLRPLVGSDKDEISDESRRLGSYPVSIIPDEDCCQLFTPRHPATKAHLDQVEAAESQLAVDEMITAAVDAVEVENFNFPPRDSTGNQS